ncbi:peptidylprolyl isomerase [Marinimicrobium sp. ABcell2]|uniref:FKBP-type peptidyl-prolyl cis-trans isomerase n=1 Tax=Marinimicrobium sp. ABcell2 TaxID=3069751 RepID=UPI0027B5E45C|nr:peptidylprolyl isomerase [Marinimicrobium sp. ABcell2]MDQ2078127.1 peptidylprolyl isomerase [Marinimicrobium sp. ABcell2]
MTDPELVVGPGTSVTLHFALRFPSGEEIDSNFEADPATFTVGDEQLLPGFEKALFGLKAGDTGAFHIEPEEGFGQHNPSNVQEMPREQFEEGLELEEGLVLSFADAQKTELPGVVVEFDDERVVVDFNHPLAGREIVFEVAILRVEPAQLH